MDTTVWVYGGDERVHAGRYLSMTGMQEYRYKGKQERTNKGNGHEKELQGKQIIAVVAGNNHMAAISGAWKLYTWGENSTGQLGLDAQYIETHFVTTPTLVTNNMLDLHPIKMVAFGKYHSACITDEGVITWGKTELLGQVKPTKQTSNSAVFLESTTVNLPNLVNMPEIVTHVACGTGHTTLITEGGDLYTFGTGNMGQLGHNDASDRSQPTLVEFFKKNNRRVVTADCGGYHSIAVCDDGRSYAFGLSTYGQTGQGPNPEESMLLSPRVITMPLGIQITSVACGESHSLLLSNIYGQCGQGNRRDHHLPMAIKFETSFPMTSIACGSNHSAAISAEGKLYLWGSGERNQLSLTATKDRLVPGLTEFPDLVRSVSCGENFTIILTGGPSKTAMTTIYSDLSSLLLVTEFSDLTFVSRDNLRFHGHKVVVYHRCPKLREEFGETSTTIKLFDLGKESLYKILEFLYTDYTYLEEETDITREVLEFARKFELPKLANLCGQLSESSASTFIPDMEKALKSTDFHDVTVLVEDKLIHANRAILAARCKFFRAMFTSGYQESNQEVVKIDECSVESFTTFLEWCYTDKIVERNNTNEEQGLTKTSSGEIAKEGEEGSALFPEMLVLADKYGAFSLFRTVEEKLLEGVDVSNILALMQFAETYNANYLAEFCLNFIAKEYDKVVERGGDNEMDADLKEKVRERRAILLGASKEEKQKQSLESRMKLYENERREQMENPKSTQMGLMARVNLLPEQDDKIFTDSM